MTSSRLASAECLVEAEKTGDRPREIIDRKAGDLDKRDRAFLMEIVFGVLRYRDTLDWILKHFLKNSSKLDKFTLNNLRTAVFQIYFMRVPDWALVNESVEIEKAASSSVMSDRSALVNAVLRNILRRKSQFDLPAKTGDPLADIALNTSHPLWLIKRWAKRLGLDETAALAHANNIVPPLTIRTNTLRISRDELIKKISARGIDAGPTLYSPDGIAVKDVRSYDELSSLAGLFYVQDEASQLIAYLLNPKPKERILDACAAPGGKTTHIAQLMGDSGEILAVEKDASRISRLRDNITNLGITSVKVINADITDLTDIGAFDRILLDAPCSASGIIRRNPEIKYRLKRGNLSDFREKQINMLLKVTEFLKEDGVITYSVCSIEPEEGEHVINSFLKSRPDFRIIDNGALTLDNLYQGGFLRTFPHVHNTDGFLGVSLCKNR